MRDSKLIEILETLSEAEWKLLNRFLDFSLSAASYDVTSLDIKALFLYLMSFNVNLSDFDAEPDDVYTKLYPDKPFKKGRIEKIMSALLQETEKFIIYQRYTNDSFYADYALMQHFFERKQFDRFERLVDKFRVYFQKTKAKDAINYLQEVHIEWLECDFQALFNTRKGDLNVRNTLNSLDLLYIVARLDFLATLLSQNRSTRLEVEENIRLLDEMDSIIFKKGYADMPLIATYRLALDILMDKGDIDLLTQKLIEHEAVLTFSQQKKLNAIIRNFYTSKYNTGEDVFIFKIAELLKKHLEKGFLYYENGLQHTTLINIVSVGLKVKDNDWVLSVLNEHRHKIISQDDSEEIYIFNTAQYYFAMGNFNAANDCLSSGYKFKNIYYELAKRRLEIKILYETGETDLCAFRNEAFKNHIFNWSKKKNALPQTSFEPNNSFIDLVEKLLTTLKGDNKRLEKLEEKIIKSRNFADRDWLLDKLNHLKKVSFKK